jgi:ABC-type antimicrobial peptide transport system permease subunit
MPRKERQEFLIRLRGHRSASIGLVAVLFVALMAIFAPYIAPYDPLEQDVLNALAPPSRSHFLGTDDIGRDLLSRIIVGSRISLSVSLLVVSIAGTVGIFTGLVAAYYEGWIDNLLAAQRTTDAELAELDCLISKGATADTNPSIAALLFDLEFHDILYKATKNEKLRQIMHQLDNIAVRVRFLSDQDDLAEQMQEYTDIYEALREHDAELAKQRMYKHVEAFSDLVAKIVSR